MAQRSLQPQLFGFSLIGGLFECQSAEINNHLPVVAVAGTRPASLVLADGEWIAWSDGIYTRKIELLP